jgi:VIT1/CCC1 family predicted Fe2+/Mn2+ transporter
MTTADIPGAPAPTRWIARVLDPVSRTTEILFGLIMVLTFTATFNVSEAGRQDVRLMLVAAVGCGLAWALIDAAMYLLSVRAERALGHRTYERLKTARPAEARRVIEEALPPLVAEALEDHDLDTLRTRLLALDPVPQPRAFTHDDYLGALAIFVLVLFATLPMAVPFVVIADPARALWVSHAIAITLLFVTGFALGRQWGQPLRVGLSMIAVGLVLVATAVALGG